MAACCLRHDGNRPADGDKEVKEVMRLKDLHVLPKTRDSLSYLYVEHCRVDSEEHAIAIWDAQGTTAVPCANLSLLMLGPGTRITHAAITTLADNGCMVAWTGEEGVRYYAHGMGETRSGRGIMRQAHLVCDPALRLEVVRAMYRMRFTDPPNPAYNLAQLRGMEGVRVRQAYAAASKASGVPWSGRSYRRDSWADANPVNRALSTANSCLYGICHAAIVAAGYSPTLGFIHTGHILSFVHDIADLYKADITIPLAFKEAAGGSTGLESRIRYSCREIFRTQRLLQRIVPDIDAVLTVTGERSGTAEAERTAPDDATLETLWDPAGDVSGGVTYTQPADPAASAWADGNGEG